LNIADRDDFDALGYAYPSIKLNLRAQRNWLLSTRLLDDNWVIVDLDKLLWGFSEQNRHDNLLELAVTPDDWTFEDDSRFTTTASSLTILG
jgi:hypothetical protein